LREPFIRYGHHTMLSIDLPDAHTRKEGSRQLPEQVQPEQNRIT